MEELEKKQKEQEILSLLRELVDFSTGDKLTDNIKSIVFNEDKNSVELEIFVGTVDNNNDTTLKRQIAKIIKIDLGYNGVKIKFIERRKSLKIAGPNTKFIIVSGGKGGVGKSFVTSNLAYSLTKHGFKIGVIDADIYGASIPTMLTMADESISVGEGNKINPFRKFGIEAISTEFFSEYEKPVLWQGNTLFTMISNFLYQVNWNKELDYVLIDMPTGTGDVLLTLGKELKDALVLIVTENDILSANMALKTAKAHQEVGQNVFGFVVNKKDDDNNLAESYLTTKLNIPLLASIPTETPSVKNFLYEDNDKNATVFNDLATIISSIIM